MLNISAARRAGRQQVELNIAPLIDIVFILLIFFLVTTSFVQQTGVDVDRPVASTAAALGKTGIMIGITADNRVFMGNREIDSRTVRINVERALVENPDAAVLIVADRRSNTGRVIEVMDACRLAGARNVSMAAGLDETAGKP
ncbi:MAG: biopolymer transporter ExbD [Desulfococcus sp. 4484_241]|nr:MAG: biopolymer transporter ExbD [Desulfococcus sp. 4484_241]